MKKEKKGFTLIELVVVLAILAVIAAIAIPTAFGSIEKARERADQATIDGLNSALRMQGILLLASYQGSNNYVYQGLVAGGLEKSTATVSAKSTTSFYYIDPQGTVIGHFTLEKPPAADLITPPGYGTAAKAIEVKNIKPGDSWMTLIGDKTSGKMGYRPIIQYY